MSGVLPRTLRPARPRDRRRSRAISHPPVSHPASRRLSFSPTHAGLVRPRAISRDLAAQVLRDLSQRRPPRAKADETAKVMGSWEPALSDAHQHAAGGNRPSPLV